MNAPDITERLRSSVARSIELVQAADDRYRVATPFMFDDGDHLALVLKRIGDRWVMSDEGHTFMRLTYETHERELRRGNRHKIITDALSHHGVTEERGVLQAEVRDDDYGSALYAIVQAILQVSDVSYLQVRWPDLRSWRTRER